MLDDDAVEGLLNDVGAVRRAPQERRQLIHLLEEANKQFDLRLFPNKTHAIAGESAQVNLYSLYLEWWKKNL